MVPKKEIVAINSDLNLSTYKEEVYEEVVYEKPDLIFTELLILETKIAAGLKELQQLTK